MHASAVAEDDVGLQGVADHKCLPNVDAVGLRAPQEPEQGIRGLTHVDPLLGRVEASADEVGHRAVADGPDLDFLALEVDLAKDTAGVASTCYEGHGPEPELVAVQLLMPLDVVDGGGCFEGREVHVPANDDAVHFRISSNNARCCSHVRPLKARRCLPRVCDGAEVLSDAHEAALLEQPRIRGDDEWPAEVHIVEVGRSRV
mmetsp:Transcript_94130/g.280915  ORF Transcript_94130/g.280915 Transcript_94130/m.280915 type:complete len:202 (+) Transcript_94130:266-871(+)